MKYSDYKEQQEHGTFNFPIAFYHKSPHSPSYEMPYHWHTYYEVIRIIFGTFHMTLDNETREYKQGDIIFITSGSVSRKPGCFSSPARDREMTGTCPIPAFSSALRSR